MAGPRTSNSSRLPADVAGRADAAYAAEVGRLVRLGRARRGMSRRQLAQESGTSERYLAQIESGAGNPTLLVMRAVADALESPIVELLPRPRSGAAAYARIIDLLGRVPAEQLGAIADTLERQANAAALPDRARRIALVGLRGAGKSTLGRMLADKLGVPFIELDRMVEQQYGASVPLLIEMSGLATFRRHERNCLERVVAENEAAVITTAGGIVSNPETYGFLLHHSHSVWISARPEEHMSRVIKQGDFRPMAHNREAMADLKAILEARRVDYARAEAVLDTSDSSVSQSFARLQKLVAPWMKG